MFSLIIPTPSDLYYTTLATQLGQEEFYIWKIYLLNLNIEVSYFMFTTYWLWYGGIGKGVATLMMKELCKV